MYQNDRLLANNKIPKKVKWVIIRAGTLELNQQQQTCIPVAEMKYYMDQKFTSPLIIREMHQEVLYEPEPVS
jgi:hypothetical protein